MFNIVFASDENFLRFLSVLITSIMKNTDSQKSFFQVHKESSFETKIRLQEDNSDKNSSQENTEGYIFHILVDNTFQSEALEIEQEKLEKCISILSLKQNYPAQIKWHILDSALFANMALPEYITHFATYFRLYLGSLLSCEKCLYLDIDMTVFCDIRELFTLDFDNFLIAAPQSDGCNNENIVGKAKIRMGKNNKRRKKDLILPRSKKYFNAGFMLINLRKWREEELEKQLLHLANSYIFIHGDQDVLNVAIGTNVYSLSASWNFLMGYFVLDRLDVPNDFFGESARPYWLISRERMATCAKNIKIAHYTHYALKPWKNYYDVLDKNHRPMHISLYSKWWDYALNTPLYDKYFASLKQDIKDKQLEIFANLYNDKLRLEARLVEIENELSQVKNIYGYEGTKGTKSTESTKMTMGGGGENRPQERVQESTLRNKEYYKHIFKKYMAILKIPFKIYEGTKRHGRF